MRLAERIVLSAAALLTVTTLEALQAQNVQRTTHLYAERDTTALFLDRYTCTSSPAAEGKTCLVFVFGGGFVTGERDAGYYVPFFEYMARRGCDVVSIDYRLGLRGMSDPSLVKAVKVFRTTVDMAVEDLFAATAFVLDHAREWGVDPSRIVACGSSAGAITVLSAENALCNGITGPLPANFDYGGIISFAGAVFSSGGQPRWKRTPCPVLLFHGTSDSNVPYDRARLFGVGFYGSQVIAAQMLETGAPCYFRSVQFGDHSLAVTPMNDDRDTIDCFIDEYVVRRRNLYVVESVVDRAHDGRPTKFSIGDYLTSNYKR